MKIIYRLFGELRKNPKLLDPKFTIPFFVGLLIALLANIYFSGIIIVLLWIMIIITGVSFVATIGKEEGSFYLLIACLMFLLLQHLYSNYLSEINYVLMGLLILPLPLQAFSLILWRYYKIMEVHYVEDVVEKYNHKHLKQSLQFYRKAGIFDVTDEYYNYFYISKIGREISECNEAISKGLRLKKKIGNSDIDKQTAEYYFSMYEEAAELLEKLSVKIAYNEEIYERSDSFYESLKRNLGDISECFKEIEKEFDSIIISSGGGRIFAERIESFSLKLTETNKALKDLNLKI